MPSPFPGMDPYLEGYLWPDVHHALAGKIRQRLAPLVRLRYVARLGVYVVEDTAPESEIGIMYPDVEGPLGASDTQMGETPAPSCARCTTRPATTCRLTTLERRPRPP